MADRRLFPGDAGPCRSSSDNRRLALKKNKTKGQEQSRKPRRLSLNRETIRILSDPALLELARGGKVLDLGTSTEVFCNTETCLVRVCQG